MNQAVIIANGLTPMMVANVLHLLIGNAIIGVVEGIILIRLLRIEPGSGRRVGLILMSILANYASAWIGHLCLSDLAHGLVESAERTPPIQTIRWVIPTIVIAAFAMSVVIEGAMIRLAVVAVRSAGWRRLLGAFVIVHLLTYAALTLFYGLHQHGPLSAATTPLVTPSQIRSPAGTVYYLEHQTGRLRAVRLAGSSDRPVMPEQTPIFETASMRMRASRSSYALWGDQVEAGWLLRTGPTSRESNEAAPIVLRGNRGTVSVWRQHDDAPAGPPLLFTASLASPDAADAERFKTWWHGGVTCTTEDAGRSSRKRKFEFETPLGSWSVSHLTALPGGLAVFAIGPAQIILWDPANNRAALLARGVCPVVVLDD